MLGYKPKSSLTLGLTAGNTEVLEIIYLYIPQIFPLLPHLDHVGEVATPGLVEREHPHPGLALGNKLCLDRTRKALQTSFPTHLVDADEGLDLPADHSSHGEL